MKTKTLLIALIVGIAASLVVFTPTLQAKGKEIRIYYEKEAQIELVSPGGTLVLIDIANPDALSKPATRKDILLTTPTHYDHFNRSFADSFPGRQMRMERGEIKLRDVNIKGIAASHSAILP